MKHQHHHHTDQTVLGSIDRINKLLRRRPKKDQQNKGRGSYRLLATLARHQNLPTTKLAEKLDITSSSLNERLAKFEEEGLITRQRNEEDQRVILVKLTEKGDAKMEELRQARKEMDAFIEGILTPEEIEQFIALATKLGDGIQEKGAK